MERSGSSSKERSNSQKSQTMTPTIIVQKVDEVAHSSTSAEPILKEASSNIFFAENYAKRSYDESPSMLIENALNRYFQLVASTKSHDLSKIVDVRVLIL